MCVDAKRAQLQSIQLPTSFHWAAVEQWFGQRALGEKLVAGAGGLIGPLGLPKKTAEHQLSKK